eukprot:GHVU01223142.1.p1 GENE.GHVU01223142.1~~GHVU01223142.1.p1  ORF type:complete len:211 (-),score=19.28 GHVU01223142.1:292-924(-)
MLPHCLDSCTSALISLVWLSALVCQSVSPPFSFISPSLGSAVYLRTRSFVCVCFTRVLETNRIIIALNQSLPRSLPPSLPAANSTPSRVTDHEPANQPAMVGGLRPTTTTTKPTTAAMIAVREPLLSEDQLFIGSRHREFKYQQKLWRRERENKDPFSCEQDFSSTWWDRKKMTSGKVATYGAPKLEVGLGKGNPNSNRWQKKNSRRGRS